VSNLYMSRIKLSHCHVLYWAHNSSTRLASSLLRDALTDSGTAPVPYRRAAFRFSVLIAVTGTWSASVISKPELTRRCRCILFVPKQPGWLGWRPSNGNSKHGPTFPHGSSSKSWVAMPSYQDECSRCAHEPGGCVASLRVLPERAESCCDL